MMPVVIVGMLTVNLIYHKILNECGGVGYYSSSRHNNNNNVPYFIIYLLSLLSIVLSTFFTSIKSKASGVK